MLSLRFIARRPRGGARCAAVLLLVGPLAAAPHGGRFRGPGLPPPAFGTVGALEPTSPGLGRSLRNADPEAWSQWWALERDRYVRPGAGPWAFDRDWVRSKVVPALLANLDGASNGALLSASLIALAKLRTEPPAVEGEAPGPTLVETFLRFAEHGNQEVAESAVMALGMLGAPDAAPLLGALLEGEASLGKKKPSRRMRALAAYGLGAIGRHTSAAAVRRYCVHHLAQALGEPAGASHDVAVACVVSLGHVRLPVREGVQPPGAAGVQPPSDSRGGQLALLHALLQDGSIAADVRAFVPVALARLAGDVPVQRELFIQELAGRLEDRIDEEAAVRAGCIQGLGFLVTPQQVAVDEIARQRLLALARGGSRLERGLALANLGRIAGRQSVGVVGGVVEQVRGLLSERLSQGKSQERPWAALGLGLLEHGARRDGKPASAQVREALRSALQGTERPDHAGALCVALGLAGDPEAEPLLVERMARGDERARGYAATGLGLLGARKALPALRAQVLESRMPQVAREAATALGRMGDRTAQGALLDQAQRARFQSHRISALLSLGLLADELGADALLRFLASEGPSPVVRAYATVALGSLLGRDAVPWGQAVASGASWWSAPPTLFDPDSGLGVTDIF